MAGVNTKAQLGPPLHRRDQLAAIANLRWRLFVNARPAQQAREVGTGLARYCHNRLRDRWTRRLQPRDHTFLVLGFARQSRYAARVVVAHIFLLASVSR